MTAYEYISKVQEVILPNKDKYVQVLVKLCNAGVPTLEAISSYFNNGGDITATRETFNLIEGINKALLNVLQARVECYNPCVNMMDEINKTIYNGYEYDKSKAVDALEFKRVRDQSALFDNFTHPDAISDLFFFMSTMLSHAIYTKYNIATIILYAEAVALKEFGSFWDFTKTEVVFLRKSIADARQGDNSKLVANCVSNIIHLNMVSDKS